MKGTKMKKILTLILAISMLSFIVKPAQADNSEEVLIGVLSGLGGFFIGSTINNRREVIVQPQYVYPAPPPPQYVYPPPQPQYVYPQQYVYPVPQPEPYVEYIEEPVCYKKKVRVYDPVTNSYIRVKKVICK